MGLYDRDYGRKERTPWDRIENPRSMTITLIIVNVVVFFVDMIFFDSRNASGLADWCGVDADSLRQPWKIWQVFTYGFVHDDRGIQHILFNMFGLFIFGRTVEQRIGAREFLRFYLIAMLIGGIIAAVSAVAMPLIGGWPDRPPTIGASGAVVAVVILFACYYPNVEILLMFILPVKAWVLAVFYVGSNTLGLFGMTGETGTAYDVHLAGVGFALLYYYRNWNLAFLDPSQGMAGIAESLQNRSRRMKLKLHDPDKKLANEAEEADRILAKIHESGEDSLTASERRILERYSKRQRDRRGT